VHLANLQPLTDLEQIAHCSGSSRAKDASH